MIFWYDDFHTRLRFLYLSMREKGEWPSAKSCKKVWPRIHAFKTLASRFLPDKHKLYWLRSRSRIKTQSCGLLWAIFLFTEVQFLQQQKRKKKLNQMSKRKSIKPLYRLSDEPECWQLPKLSFLLLESLRCWIKRLNWVLNENCALCL